MAASLAFVAMSLLLDSAKWQDRSVNQVLAEMEAIGEPDFDPARKPEPG